MLACTVTLRPIGLGRWHRHTPSLRKWPTKKMPLAVFPAASKHICPLLPTLVLPRSGSSGRRHGSRPLSPVARAPVFFFVLHFTPAFQSLSTPRLACSQGWLYKGSVYEQSATNAAIEVGLVWLLPYPAENLLWREIRPDQRHSCGRKETMAVKASLEFQIFAKPVGAICNLDCHYCYYLQKELLYPQTQSFRM